MNDGREEYRITWVIENYSYCWHNTGECLKSPKFTAEGLGGTKWFLRIFPRGCKENSRSHISLFLHRSAIDNGPAITTVDFKLSILASDGSSVEKNKADRSFKNKSGYGVPKLRRMDEVLFRRKTDFLHQDRLSVNCVIWKGEGNVQKITQFNAVTRIGIKHMSFLHVVEDFSSLLPNMKNTVQIKSPLGCEFLSSNVYYSDNSCCKGKLMVEIMTSSFYEILTKCKLSLLDVSGKLIEGGMADSRFDCPREDIDKLSLSLTKTIIMNRKDEYCPYDKLSLLCDCTFSTGIEFKKIESIQQQIPLMALNSVNNHNQNKVTYNAAEKLFACPGALDDFQSIYSDLFLTDVILKTETKLFHAHKIVLCARSSVFKAMLTTDMKEKNTNCIQVDDIEDDIAQQFLLFLYTDKLDNLQWESAIKLYYVGDKYNVAKLKVLCSSFLQDNVNTSNAPQLLVLADTHSDSDLKKFVEGFILEHDEEVFSSNEWEQLIKISPQLVIKTIHLKYKRNKEEAKDSFHQNKKFKTAL